MAQSKAWETSDGQTDSTVIGPGLKGLNPHLPLKTAEQPISGVAHHHSPCCLISSIRLHPCFLLDTCYCVAFPAFHSVTGSFILAPPGPGMSHRKRRGVSGILWTQFCHPTHPWFLLLSSLLWFRHGPWIDISVKKHFTSISAHQGMEATTLCLTHLQYLL